MKMSEYAKEINLKMSQHKAPEEIDTLLGKMNSHFEVALKEYYNLVKKLRDWAVE